MDTKDKDHDVLRIEAQLDLLGDVLKKHLKLKRQIVKDAQHGTLQPIPQELFSNMDAMCMEALRQLFVAAEWMPPEWRPENYNRDYIGRILALPPDEYRRFMLGDFVAPEDDTNGHA